MRAPLQADGRSHRGPTISHSIANVFRDLPSPQLFVVVAFILAISHARGPAQQSARAPIRRGGKPFQRQWRPQAAPTKQPPRPVSRFVRAGRPHRPCFPHADARYRCLCPFAGVQRRARAGRQACARAARRRPGRAARPGSWLREGHGQLPGAPRRSRTAHRLSASCAPPPTPQPVQPLRPSSAHGFSLPPPNLRPTSRGWPSTALVRPSRRSGGTVTPHGTLPLPLPLA